jgi:hypothetical protein
VQGCDRRLQHVGIAAAERQRALEHGASLRDLIDVPQRSILVAEEDDRTLGESRFPPGVVQEHERQQSMHLGLVGHQLGECTPEPDRLGRKLPAAAVALVEDQVHDREHRGEAVGEQMRRRHAKRNPRGLDLAFRASEPLRHGRLGHEEGTGDLLRLEAAERPQGERDLGVERECRVAAREEELEPLIGDRRLIHGVLHCLGHVEQPGLDRKRAVAADAVDRTVARRRHEPAAGVGGRPFPRPALGSNCERLLGSFLGEVEIAEEADQAGEDAAPLLAEDLLERH